MKPISRVLFASPLLLPASAWGQVATNLNLNIDYSSLQAAISGASEINVHTISLSPGVYEESLDIDRSIEIVAPDGATISSEGGAVIVLQGGVSLTLEEITVSSADDNTRAIDARNGSNTLIVRDGAFDTRVSNSNSGGGINATEPLLIEIENTTFIGAGSGYVQDGGALFVSSTIGGSVTLTDVTFDGVQAFGEGGAVYTRGVDLTCTRCSFDETGVIGSGGAIYVEGGRAEVLDSLFCGSEATLGGAIYGDSGGTLRNNRFVDADASFDGGALYANGGTWTVTNNHFLSSAAAGAIGANASSTIDVVNNLFLDNEGLAINIAGILNTAEYNWFEGNSGNLSTGVLPPSNITVGDPELVDWATGNCSSDQLIPTPITSPLLDAGDPSLLDPDGSISDIGAFGGPDADPGYHVDADNDGASFLWDCDDSNGDRFPGNPEVCDSYDNDCNDLVDDNPEDIDTFYPDCDNDGQGTTDGALTQCFEPPPLSCAGDWVSANQAGTTAGLDCDDEDPLVNTDADELCADGDQNCDGDDDFGAVDGEPYYRDGDGDSYGGILETSCDVTPPDGYVEVPGDCDDSDPDINPGILTDVCGDNIDTDCNGGDGDDSAVLEWYPDSDHDGYGEITTTPVIDCNDLGASGDYTSIDLALDCDDTSKDVNPDATEVCNSIDDDCNHIADDVQSSSTWYEDQDGDLFGNTAAPVTSSCPPDEQWLAQGGDCDDSDPTLNPNAEEICNGIDDDCDARIDAEDDDAVGVDPVYEDWDADGYGACDNGAETCAPFSICPDDRTDNHSSNSDDCNDADAAQNPSRQEISGNAIDENCDGEIPGGKPPKVDGDEDPGCNCSTGAAPVPMTLLGLFLLLSIRRRRP